MCFRNLITMMPHLASKLVADLKESGRDESVASAKVTQDTFKALMERRYLHPRLKRQTQFEKPPIVNLPWADQEDTDPNCAFDEFENDLKAMDIKDGVCIDANPEANDLVKSDLIDFSGD